MNSKDYRIKGFMLPERRKYINPKIPRQKKSILRIKGFKDFVTEKTNG